MKLRILANLLLPKVNELRDVLVVDFFIELMRALGRKNLITRDTNDMIYRAFLALQAKLEEFKKQRMNEIRSSIKRKLGNPDISSAPAAQSTNSIAQPALPPQAPPPSPALTQAAPGGEAEQAQDTVCITCCETFNNHNRIRVKFDCSGSDSPHMLCQECALKQAEVKPICPFCRAPLKTNSTITFDTNGQIITKEYSISDLSEQTLHQLRTLLQLMQARAGASQSSASVPQPRPRTSLTDDEFEDFIAELFLVNQLVSWRARLEQQARERQLERRARERQRAESIERERRERETMRMAQERKAETERLGRQAAADRIARENAERLKSARPAQPKLIGRAANPLAREAVAAQIPGVQSEDDRPDSDEESSSKEAAAARIPSEQPKHNCVEIDEESTSDESSSDDDTIDIEQTLESKKQQLRYMNFHIDELNRKIENLEKEIKEYPGLKEPESRLNAAAQELGRMKAMAAITAATIESAEHRLLRGI